LAYWYLQTRVYYPVVHVVLPDGLTIVTVLPDTRDVARCRSTNERFVAPFKKTCKECTITSARCDQHLEGLELSMRTGAPVPHSMVVARDFRLVVMGPAANASAACQVLAKDFVSKGVPSAACVPPGASAPRS
jgi:hypothetical protein